MWRGRRRSRPPERGLRDTADKHWQGIKRDRDPAVPRPGPRQVAGVCAQPELARHLAVLDRPGSNLLNRTWRCSGCHTPDWPRSARFAHSFYCM